jgi:GNAT superfamily N-acetyltransferase
MENTEMLAFFDKEIRRECERPGKRRQALPGLVRYMPVDGGRGGSFISWSDLTADSADAAIQSQIDTFRKVNSDFEWIYYSYDLPTDLPKRLLAYGFTAKEPLALMVVNIGDLPVEYWTRDVSTVKRITTPEGVDEIIRMQCEVWEEDLAGFARSLKNGLEHHPADLSVYAVWQDGRVVSAAWTHFLSSTSFATLSGGSTLKAYRHRGFYTDLLAVRAREARQRGFRFLQVNASPDSQPILAKHGFRCLAVSTAYQWKSKVRL